MEFYSTHLLKEEGYKPTTGKSKLFSGLYIRLILLYIPLIQGVKSQTRDVYSYELYSEVKTTFLQFSVQKYKNSVRVGLFTYIFALKLLLL